LAHFDFLMSMYEVQFYKSSYYSCKQMAVLFGLKYHTPNFKYLPYKNTLTNFTQICLYSSTVLSTLVSDRCFQTRQLYHLLKHSHWMCDALIDAACFDVRKPWSLSHSCRFHFSRCHGESPDRI